MTVPELSREAIDRCEQFRSAWTLATSGVAGVAEYVARFGDLSQVDRNLLVNLIKIDLEFIWSHWADRATQDVRAAVDPDLLIERWKLLPRFQNYSALFQSREETSRYWARLANIESHCRDRWGDAIGSQFYQHYFEVPTEDFLRRPRRHMRCEFDQNDEYSQILFPLRGRNEIGRQRTKDVEPYFVEANPDGNRIVVANRYEAEVSREQLMVQLLSPAVAVIFNRSGVNSVRLSPDQILAPGSKACALFPFTIQIPGRRLCCF